jgi:hypothetical protein
MVEQQPLQLERPTFVAKKTNLFSQYIVVCHTCAPNNGSNGNKHVPRQ